MSLFKTAKTVIGSSILKSTANSVLFIDVNKKLAQDNTNFTWNDSTNTLFVANIDLIEGNITNVSNIALDTISSDAGTNVRVILGTGSGNEFTINNGAVDVLTSAGDTLVTTVQSIETLSTNGIIIPAIDTYAFTRTGDVDTGLFFNTVTANYEFHRDASVRAIVSARSDANFSFEGVGDVALIVAADTFAFASKSATTSGMFFNNTSSQLEIRFGNTPTHVFGATGTLQIDSNMTIGSGAAGVDYTLIFDGENNNGVITWMEDEARFVFDSAVLVTGFHIAITTKTNTDYTLTKNDDVVLFSTGDVDRTATLPAAATVVGKVYHIKKTDSGGGNVIIDGDGTETIDEDEVPEINGQFESFSIVSDGVGWHVI